MQLVILAAGMGSRFGGLKQMEPMDEYGNFLLDYSVYDAKRAGFDSVVFIIKKAFYEAFKDSIGKRVEKIIKVDYAFQDLEDIPAPYKVPEGREKPWGTAHAIYAAREYIHDDFIIINGDDFYGRDTYQVAHDYLASLSAGSIGKYANVAFQVANTMTENGAVKRGVVFSDDGVTMSKLIESNVEHEGEKIACTPLEGGDKYYVEADHPVSMNLFIFNKDLMDCLVEKFPAWLEKHGQELKSEFLIPSVVDELVHEGKASVSLLTTSSVWFGVTYKEDKPAVVASLKKLVEAGEYKEGIY